MNKSEKSRRILIIEDNLDSVETLKTLLEMQTHTLEVAFDARSGIDKSLSFTPEVIICDIGLPGDLDGYDVAKIIRENESLSSVTLIALSGYGQKEDVQKAIESGFDFHIVKPPDFDKLFRLIGEAKKSQE